MVDVFIRFQMLLFAISIIILIHALFWITQVPIKFNHLHLTIVVSYY